MRINQEGLELIKKFEGLQLKAYKCPAGIWTIGYGHTGGPVGGVKEGDLITKDQAEVLLQADLLKFEEGVMKIIRDKNEMFDPNPNEFSALVCFAFNVGLGNLKKSTLMKKYLAGPTLDLAADEFLKWNKAGGKVLKGLTARRTAERELFLKV